jgi:hypothetical protein
MSKREVIYLVFNVPVCLWLFIILLIINQGLMYSYSSWNPDTVITFVLVLLIILLIDLITMGLLKILNKRMVLFTLFEFVFVCCFGLIIF